MTLIFKVIQLSSGKRTQVFLHELSSFSNLPIPHCVSGYRRHIKGAWGEKVHEIDIKMPIKDLSDSGHVYPYFLFFLFTFIHWF